MKLTFLKVFVVALSVSLLGSLSIQGADAPPQDPQGGGSTSATDQGALERAYNAGRAQGYNQGFENGRVSAEEVIDDDTGEEGGCCGGGGSA